MKHILKCQVCSCYTMVSTCKCGGAAVNPKPAKYSPQDSYGAYRRKAKMPEWQKRGFL
ncbi:MAG: nucleolar RNA-binding Nop10p family protein [archaeon]